METTMSKEKRTRLIKEMKHGRKKESMAHERLEKRGVKVSRKGRSMKG